MQSSNSRTSWQITADNNQIIYAHPDIQQEITADWFNAAYWNQKKAISGESKGRYTTYFIRQQQTDSPPLNMVLRHYYRGGLIAKLSKDKFVYTGLSRTRCIQELNLLQQMSSLGLPVPKPIAALVTKVSPWQYTNDILIERFLDVKDGFQRLTKQALAAEVWRKIGNTIKRFHRVGVYHSDLNIHNILLGDGGDVYLIDFDRCDMRKPDEKWQQSNLARLLRSLSKEKSLNKNFHFEQSDWALLLEGYNE